MCSWLEIIALWEVKTSTSTSLAKCSRMRRTVVSGARRMRSIRSFAFLRSNSPCIDCRSAPSSPSSSGMKGPKMIRPRRSPSYRTGIIRYRSPLKQLRTAMAGCALGASSGRTLMCVTVSVHSLRPFGPVNMYAQKSPEATFMSTSLVPLASKTLRPTLYRSTNVLQTLVKLCKSSNSPRTGCLWMMLSATSSGSVRGPLAAAARRAARDGRIHEAPSNFVDECAPVQPDLLGQEIGLVDLLEGELHQPQEGLDHSLSLDRDRLVDRLLVLPPHLLDGFVGRGVTEVLLVPLDHVGHRIDVQAVRLEVLHHVQPVLVVFLALARLAVGDEGDGVGALQHDPAGRVVHHLAGHREELELHLEGAGGENQGKGVEEKGAVVGRVQGHQVTAELWLDALVERAQVRRLPREAGALIDDLERQLALSRIELHPAVTLPSLRPNGPLRGPGTPPAIGAGKDVHCE